MRDMQRRLLPLIITLVQASIAAGQTTLSTPISLPNPNDGRAQLSPSVASDGGTTFVVAWQQGRRYYESEEADIFAARVTSAGTPIDVTPISVSTVQGSQERPRVAFAGGVFLIVWHDDRDGQLDIYGALLSADGVVLSPESIRLTNRQSSQAMPAVTALGDEFIVAWQDAENGRYELAATTVSADGVVATINGDALADSDGSALTGGEIELTSTDGRVFAQRRNDHGWRPAEARNIRGVLELGLSGGAVTVADLDTVPNGHFDVTQGRLASMSGRWLLTTGGAARSARFGRGTIFEGLAPITNGEDEPMFEFTSYNSQGPFAAAGGENHFLITYRRMPNNDAPASLRFLRVDRDGAYLDDAGDPPIIEIADAYESAIGSTAGDVFLVAYEVSSSSGNGSIHVCAISH